MWDLTIHPPSGPSVLAGTRSFLQSMWDPHQIHPLRGPTSLLAHHLVSTPLWGTASSLTHHPVSGSDTNCNDSGPQLADIVLFGLPLKVFKTCLLGRGFHTLKRVFRSPLSFSSPTNVGSYTLSFVLSCLLCGSSKSKKFWFFNGSLAISFRLLRLNSGFYSDSKDHFTQLPHRAFFAASGLVGPN